ncbi:hypothetical protein MMC34_000009 [Xylographa carneopallida]|nr:hypothetical protein [Xylographa carneopallida]
MTALRSGKWWSAIEDQYGVVLEQLHLPGGLDGGFGSSVMPRSEPGGGHTIVIFLSTTLQSIVGDSSPGSWFTCALLLSLPPSIIKSEIRNTVSQDGSSIKREEFKIVEKDLSEEITYARRNNPKGVQLVSMNLDNSLTVMTSYCHFASTRKFGAFLEGEKADFKSRRSQYT